MHILEDHIVERVRCCDFGLGLLGEQGAESVHKEVNSIMRTMSGIVDKKERLLSDINEHYFRCDPQISQNIPKKEKSEKATFCKVVAYNISIRNNLLLIPI